MPMKGVAGGLQAKSDLCVCSATNQYVSGVLDQYVLSLARRSAAGTL